MNSEKKLSTHLKKAFHALTILVCFGGLTSLCLGNDGTKLTINGGDPIPGPGSVLCWASVDQGEIVSCTWSADPSNGIATTEPQGNHQCRVAFTAFGSISLTCNATVMLNGNSKSASDSKTIRCEAPTTNAPTLKIDGPGEVSINSMHEYTAKYSGYEGTPRISWQYHGGTDSGERTTIHFLTNMTHHLECTLYYNEGNTEKSLFAEMYIKVLPEVSLTAMRADYKNYTNAVISGSNLVYIHFNVDDDDESAGDNTQGIDCDQKEFANGKTDDDLCKVQLSLGEGIEAEDLTDGTLYFEINNGLRLWTSPKRTQILLENYSTNNLRKGFSFANGDKTNVILKILNEGFYVEGMRSGRHELKISFAANELNLPYFCCSVGGKADQPTGKQRKYYKEVALCNFKDLVGCEWCVKKLTPSSYLRTYNCIAYAVDPEREVFRGTNIYARPFEGAFWVAFDETANDYLQGFDSWDESNWRKDPFLYCVSITEYAFDNLLKTKFQDGLWDTNITTAATINPETGLFIFAGYSFAFKNLLSDVLKEQSNLIKLEYRYTTMTILNRGSSYSDFVDNFFNLPDFATTLNNNHQLQSCDTNDTGRVISYYPEYHAARSLANAPGCDNFDDNIDPSWEISASKCGGAEELLIHRERQLTFPYGLINKAYK